MKQTAQILKYGHTSSTGQIIGKNSALARGTAMVGGGYIGKFTLPHQTVQAIQQAVAAAPATAKPTNTVKAAAPKSQAAQKEAEKFKETLDWVEVLIDRLERKISQLDTVASSVFKTATERTTALTDEFTKVREEVEISSKALETYQKRMDSIGLSQTYIDKIKNGKLEIEDINNEDVYKKIQEYQEWYEKYLDIFYKVTDLHEQLGEIVKANFDLIETNYSTMVENIEYEVTKLESSMDILTKKGMYAGEAYYVELMNNEVKIMNKLTEKYDGLIDVRQQALDSGEIDAGSEADLEMLNIIRETEQAWVDAKSQYLEYRNALREANWEIFEKGIEYVSDINAELDFMIDLLSEVENKLYNEDTGRFTDRGMMVGALHAQNYEVYMRKAQEYEEEVQKINEELASDPHNVILLDKKQEYIGLQRDSIQAAMQERDAIKNLVSESYNRMIEALEKIIDLRREALSAEKDLYTYSKNIENQTKSLASLRKQLMSIQGDDSEEAKARRQILTGKIEEAEDQLEETEYDRFIADTDKLLSSMTEDMQEFLNKRLDDVDGLLQSMINYGNENGDKIADSMVEVGNKFGYDLSTGLEQTWRNLKDNQNTLITGVDKDFADWNKSFGNVMTKTNNYIEAIFKILKKATKSNVAVDSVHGVTTDEILNPPKPTPPPAPATPSTNQNNNNSGSNTTASKPAASTAKTVKVGSKVRVGANIPIYYDSYGRVGPNGSRQYFAYDPVYYVMRENNGYWLLRHHSESTAAGWFKKGVGITALKTGGYTGTGEGMAMLHKKERVLSAVQTKAFENLVYQQLPELMNLKMNVSAIPKQNVNTNINNDMNVTFNLPNVTDPQSFMKELQGNKQFERLIQSMTLDQLNGKNGLSKNKFKI